MQAGQLRKRVVLQKRAPTTDAEGQTSDNWIPIQTIWAQVSSVGGSESTVAGQPEVRITHQVTTRYRSDLALATAAPTPNEGHNLRLLLGARVLDIQTVEPDDKQTELDLRCTERQR